MEMSRKLEMTVRSASGLDDVTGMGQMRVYATASLSDDSATILQKTDEVDTTGGTNPVWNSNMSFSISRAQFQHLNLVFGLYCCERTLLGDKRFAEVRVPLNVLRAEHSYAYTEVSYPVSNLKNNSHGGKLNFSYRFQDNLPYPRAPPNYPNTMGAGSTSRPPLMRPQRPQNPWHSPQSSMRPPPPPPPPPQHPWIWKYNFALACQNPFGTTDGYYDHGYSVDYYDTSWNNDLQVVANDTSIFDIFDAFLG